VWRLGSAERSLIEWRSQTFAERKSHAEHKSHAERKSYSHANGDAYAIPHTEPNTHADTGD
jgi:hypothetical protein